MVLVALFCSCWKVFVVSHIQIQVYVLWLIHEIDELIMLIDAYST